MREYFWLYVYYGVQLAILLYHGMVCFVRALFAGWEEYRLTMTGDRD